MTYLFNYQRTVSVFNRICFSQEVYFSLTRISRLEIVLQSVIWQILIFQFILAFKPLLRIVTPHQCFFNPRKSRYQLGNCALSRALITDKYRRLTYIHPTVILHIPLNDRPKILYPNLTHLLLVILLKDSYRKPPFFQSIIIVRYIFVNNWPIVKPGYQ